MTNRIDVLGGNDRPQILHVVTRYLRGGSEQRVRDIIAAFGEADHHVVLGSESEPAAARRDLEPKHLMVLRSLVRQPSPVNDADTLWRLVRLLRRSSFDLLITHQSKAGVLGRTAAWIDGRVPVIHSLSMASFGPGYGIWQDRLFRSIERKLERVTSAYAVVGDDLALRYASIGVPRDKLVVVRSGVRFPDEIRSDAARRKASVLYHLPFDRPWLLYLGSLEPRKRVLELVPLLHEVITLAPSQSRPFLVVAGEGPLARRLAEDLVANGLAPDSKVLGYVERPGALIASAAALVLLSEAEGISQVLIQAASVGTPFVAYDVDGAGELIDLGAVGSAVPLGEVHAAAEAVARHLEHPSDPTPILDLTAWAPEQIAEGYRSLIDDVLMKGGQAPNGGDVREGKARHATANSARRWDHQ